MPAKIFRDLSIPVYLNKEKRREGSGWEEREAFEGWELTLISWERGSIRLEAAVSVAEWKQKPFTGAHFPYTALEKGRSVCTNHWVPENTKIPGVLSDYPYNLFPRQKITGIRKLVARSTPKTRAVPKHSFLQNTVLAKAAKPPPQLQQRRGCWEAASLITHSHGLDAEGSHKKTAQKNSAHSIWDLWCLTSWFLPLSHSRRPTWVCMATNYIGHLPSCTDLDNTMGYILSEINCS